MPVVTCHLKGKDYKLEYRETPVKNGGKISGILHLDKPLEFSFIIYDFSKHKSFTPANTDKMVCDAITDLITKERKTHN